MPYGNRRWGMHRWLWWFDKLQNEYGCLFNDFEKLRHRYKDYKKIITTLTLDVEKAKHDYDVVIDNKNELEKCSDNLKSENKALRLELEEKSKALENCLKENVAFKISINEKGKHTNIYMQINHLRRSMHILLAMNVVEKAILFFITLLMLNLILLRKFGFLKVLIF